MRVPALEPTQLDGVNEVLTASRCQSSLGVIQMIVGVLVTFLVVILVLYLINMLPLDGRAKQIARAIVIIIGIVSLLKYLAVF